MISNTPILKKPKSNAEVKCQQKMWFVVLWSKVTRRCYRYSCKYHRFQSHFIFLNSNLWLRQSYNMVLVISFHKTLYIFGNILEKIDKSENILGNMTMRDAGLRSRGSLIRPCWNPKYFFLSVFSHDNLIFFTCNT